MDAGYAVLFCVLGFIAVMVVWGITGISPLGFLRMALGDGVNNYEPSLPSALPPILVMSREKAQTAQTEQANGQTDEAPDADRWLEQVGVDRTRTMLIRLLVYKGWGVGEIRNAIKGDSTAIGLEVEAVRKQFGMAPTAPYVTPIAGRPTDQKYYPKEPELEFQPPPN